jgi:hypothetical protein
MAGLANDPASELTTEPAWRNIRNRSEQRSYRFELILMLQCAHGTFYPSLPFNEWQQHSKSTVAPRKANCCPKKTSKRETTMKKVLAILAALAISTSLAYAEDPPAAAQPAPPSAGGTPTPGKEAGQPTSNRTPGKETPTPLGQTTKSDGATSDRTPGNNPETGNK